MFDWNDLRFFLAVARGGSTLAASRALHVNQTTVARRIEALEHALGAKLFERGQTGSRLTETGEALVAPAEAAERACGNVVDQVRAQTRQHAGVLRVTTNESLASFAVTPSLLEFRRAYPEIEVELIITDRFLDLTKGEADLAIRGATHAPADPGVIARRLINVAWGFYCSRDYARRYGWPRTPEALDNHLMIGGEGELAQAPAVRWMMQAAPNARVHCRSNSLSNLVQAAKAGLGVAPLPGPMAAAEPELICCLPPVEGLDAHVYLLTTPALKNVPRVRAFIDFMVPIMVARTRAVMAEAERRNQAFEAEMASGL